MQLISKIAVQNLRGVALIGLMQDCWYHLLGLVDMHLSEIMQFNIKLFNSGVPAESHKEDTSAEELKTTDETVETTEASMYMY